MTSFVRNTPQQLLGADMAMTKGTTEEALVGLATTEARARLQSARSLPTSATPGYDRTIFAVIQPEYLERETERPSCVKY